MQADKASRRPTTHCHNCGLACNELFCCEWCTNTYLARMEAHRGGQARHVRSRPDKSSMPGTDETPARG